MPQAVIYARYSSHNQRDVSIEQQVDACRKYAAENDMQILRVYADRAMSGTTDARPAFQQMIRDSASRAFSFVLVYSLDRFSRDRYASAVHKHTLKEHGVRVLSAVENLRDDPTGVLMESILEGFAEYYSKELAQKIKRGQRSNAEKCLAPGSLPLGYVKGEDGRYAVEPSEAAVVREVFGRVAAGEPFVSIFDDLNRRSVLTKKGRPWNRSSFSKLLSNQRYIGVYEFAGVRVEGGVPAIIDRGLWDRVQVYLENKKSPRGPQRRRREGGMYLLTGKLFCGECGGPMVGTSGTGKHGELHYYYACRGKLKEGSSCPKRNAARDYVEAAVARAVQGLIFASDRAEAIADELLLYLEENRDTDEIRGLRARVAQLEKEQANVLRAIRQGVIAPAVQDMLTEIEGELSSCRARLSVAEAQQAVPFTREEILAVLDMFREGDLASKEYQLRLFDAFLVRAYLYDDRLTLLLNYTGRGTSEVEVPLELSPPGSGSDKLSASPLNEPYPNPRLIRGLYVVTVRI